jgi:hypothetical protein
LDKLNLEEGLNSHSTIIKKYDILTRYLFEYSHPNTKSKKKSNFRKIKMFKHDLPLPLNNSPPLGQLLIIINNISLGLNPNFTPFPASFNNSINNILGILKISFLFFHILFNAS